MIPFRLTPLVVIGSVLLAGAGVLAWTNLRERGWSAEERSRIESLSIAALTRLPPDPSNRFADNPRAVRLGHRLFFDARLSSSRKVSCATCHLPDKAFTDGLPLAKGVGTTDRKTMTVIGTAHSQFLFWDGRKDSLWAQALGPLESPVEHGGDRTMYAHLIARHYRAEYEALFGPLPDLSGPPERAGPVEDANARAAWARLSDAERQAVTRVFANVGKAIAAYERKLMPGESRFDRFARALQEDDRQGMKAALSRDEAAGLRLFIGRANCTDCHSGPLFTNNDFHNTGIPAAAGLPRDAGRAAGVLKVRDDEFNCLSPYSDAKPGQCGHLRFLKTDGHELTRAFKVPTLRNISLTAPYMHAGQKRTLREVLEHYNQAPQLDEHDGHSELKPLNLSDGELGQLEAFLRTLDSPVSAPAELLRAPQGSR